MRLFVLGRQAKLSLAELESLFGADNLPAQPQSDVALVKADVIDFELIGGSLKSARQVAKLDKLPQKQLAVELAKLIPPSSTKINLGISWHGSSDSRGLKALALETKKVAKSQGLKIRVVPTQSGSTLSSAQTWHNRLDKAPNVELLIVESNGRLVVGQVDAVQNIEAYGRRDHGRPARDSRVGMLPPKLAQIMINLAGIKQGRILDPFCGTGVLLQEAARIGLVAYGSDIDQRMVDYSRRNLEHLGLKAELELADARDHIWTPPINAIISETYLGPPLTQLPTNDKLVQLAADSGQLTIEFLNNIAKQLGPKTPLVLALPAWFDAQGKVTHSTAVDQIGRLGYTRRSFESASWQDLIYHRPNQIVGREILVLVKD